MPEIGALLHDAVPPDDGEPDLDEIAHLAGRRRRRRRTARVVLPLAVLAIVAPGLWVFGGNGGDGAIVAGDPTSTTTAGADEASEAAQLVRFLARHAVPASDEPDPWPLLPADFFRTGPPDTIMVGTIASAGSGAFVDTVCEGGQQGAECGDQPSLEIDVRFERFLWPDPEDRTSNIVSVAWPADPAVRDEDIPAPVGARVLVVLETGEGTLDRGPAAISAVVVEDGDGVAVPTPDPANAHQPIDFDDYVAEVEELQGQDG